ncbi:MAG TPA: DegT/DnrJ/EryC1/StrS family aminotransferase [Planctomycetota bacterium]|jgi:dTDP-4-amino-4,6-dideoxygalactose transaminase
MAEESVIPFLDLKAQYRSIKNDIDAALSRVLESTQFVLGKEVAAFEEEFAGFCHTKQAIGVNSGTSALHLALLAAGVGAGDEVITVPFTFVATVAAIGYSGAKPVFVDTDPRSFTMDPSLIEKAITPRTKAIIPVHLYGQCADMDPILAIARKHNLRVIEDAAQAHAAEYKGRRAGCMGDMGCFSFYPGKNLGAYGEAGAVVTDNAEFAKTIRVLRDWGQEKRYYHDLKGFNARMEGFQGAILRVKLRHLPAWTDARRAHAAQYREALAGSGVQTPTECEYARHVYHVFAARTSRREVLQKVLTQHNIQWGIHYPVPVHLQKAWAELGHKEGDFPHSEKAAREVFSLPLFPELTTGQIARVAAAVKEAHVL